MKIFAGVLIALNLLFSGISLLVAADAAYYGEFGIGAISLLFCLANLFFAVGGIRSLNETH